ncbi:hypothetical protein [Terricaulis sp.]|uniref:hypothetical protein n=1 Tax=Terricaulis sp. TaxID=2768686 RepID=UPI002AC622B7|nr:hypothetical protein [Terricaulis sp.]MDZ4690250.1 hypothetical protein [Terricaulis sp.]
MNDEIERRLFGKLDSKGANAVRAFIGADVHGWVENFETFFTYIDAQKIRTPKGLAWLKAQYPALNQNELMMEMQGIRTMHCSIWSSGVREVVSAEDSDVKFIITDHPVTIFNHAISPDDAKCRGGNEPGIALKGSQTIFPLNRDFCLILTNLEYARDPEAKPLEKRTFARNYAASLVKADAMVRERKLTAFEVSKVNYVLKKRAGRFIAAGKLAWLHPETSVTGAWKDLRHTLLPPRDSLWGFGGEIYARYEDGRVHFQDEFGRTEKPWDFLLKTVDESTLRPSDGCGCGSGKRYRDCCKARPVELRTSWTERSIRERNLLLYKAIAKELGLDSGRSWVEIRAQLTDDQIKRIYSLYAALWPLETDLLQLLPKPDGTTRAVYTGCIHPCAITEFALGAPLYFGELLVEHPFVHAGAVSKAFSPVENPRAYRQEFLKSVVFLLTVMPLVDAGLVNLVPDPCNFDIHLRDQMFDMAQARMRGIRVDPKKDPRMRQLMEEDAKRGMLALPEEALRGQARRWDPEMNEERMQEFMQGVDYLKRSDPLAVLQAGTFDGGEEGGLLNMYKLSPNFELAMYLAQLVGGSIVTDSLHRWEEIQRTIRWRPPRPSLVLLPLSQAVSTSDFAFPQQTDDILDLDEEGVCGGYAAAMKDAFHYVSRIEKKGEKPNVEAGIVARFRRGHASAQATLAKRSVEIARGKVTCAFPWGGFQHNNVNRLLLMSSSDHHMPSVPMAFYISRPSK